MIGVHLLRALALALPFVIFQCGTASARWDQSLDCVLPEQIKDGVDACLISHGLTPEPSERRPEIGRPHDYASEELAICAGYRDARPELAGDQHFPRNLIDGDRFMLEALNRHVRPSAEYLFQLRRISKIRGMIALKEAIETRSSGAAHELVMCNRAYERALENEG